MPSVEDLYDAIEAGDVHRVLRVLDEDPGLVDGDDATPPPLHWAIYHDRPAVAEALLTRGAAIERRDQDRDSTPLAYAIVFGRREVAQLLMRSGANTDGMYELALRGAAGAFEEYPDVASREQFEELANMLRDV